MGFEETNRQSSMFVIIITDPFLNINPKYYFGLLLRSGCRHG